MDKEQELYEMRAIRYAGVVKRCVELGNIVENVKSKNMSELSKEEKSTTIKFMENILKEMEGNLKEIERLQELM